MDDDLIADMESHQTNTSVPQELSHLNPTGSESIQPNPDILDPDRIPQHVAIIMDGNGRWATRQGLSRHEGHFAGYQALKKVVYASSELGVQFLTVYGFSSENWRRPADEVGGLMDLMSEAMRAELEELIQHGFRVRISGRLEQLPERTRTIFREAMERTTHHTGLTFTLAINYGGRAEIVDTVRRIVDEANHGLITVGDIDEIAISQRLYWPDCPDPDLLIRTAGELRLSNFLMWETAYSEIFVTQTLWPDFDGNSLILALADYQKRVRRFGAVVE